MRSKLSKLKKLLRKSDDIAFDISAGNEEAKFVLKYGSIKVGTLVAKDGKWKFEYDSEFKHQDELKPIVDFPNINRKYESRDLWPFFLVRIPSPEQPQIDQLLQEENLNKDNPVQMLKRFGQRSIANPFELIACEHF
jgi:HipA-like protein